MKRTTSIAKLDNPVWYSLAETNSKYSVNFGNTKFYDPAYAPFGAVDGDNDLAAAIENYLKYSDGFYILGAKPVYPASVKLITELVCLQMVIDKPIDIEQQDEIVILDEKHEKELFKLVNMVQPGYFRTNTASMGEYVGIFKDGALVAASGERMKMNDFTEVSAVVTHPEHTGKGYAKQLVMKTVSKIFAENKIPFLHVAEQNEAAINLYKKLGFVTRTTINCWGFIKA